MACVEAYLLFLRFAVARLLFVAIVVSRFLLLRLAIVVLLLSYISVACVHAVVRRLHGLRLVLHLIVVVLVLLETVFSRCLLALWLRVISRRGLHIILHRALWLWVVNRFLVLLLLLLVVIATIAVTKAMLFLLLVVIVSTKAIMVFFLLVIITTIIASVITVFLFVIRLVIGIRLGSYRPLCSGRYSIKA